MYIYIYTHTVPALTNAGPDCDPCGGPLKVIVQRKKKNERFGMLT
jgi:hypothetical protein